MIQDLSGSWCIKGTDKSMTRVDSPVPLIHHDPDRSWIPDPDHPKGTHPKSSALPLALTLKAKHNRVCIRYISFKIAFHQSFLPESALFALGVFTWVQLAVFTLFKNFVNDRL